MSNSVWRKLERSKKYREAFVGSQVKRTVPFQIRALRKQRGWSQTELAERAGVTQGVISRAEDPDYGNLTLNTIVRVAAGFDCAFIGRFVPFSELVGWYDSLSEAVIRVASFSEDRDSRPAANETTTFSHHAAISIGGAGTVQSQPRSGQINMFPAMLVGSSATHGANRAVSQSIDIATAAAAPSRAFQSRIDAA
jgi:transcriptional regulator with XRE-family HTH domain